MTARRTGPGEWVLLTYRMPHEPSTPRSSVWRKLRRLGGASWTTVSWALPADARTRERLEWVAEEVREADGTAGVWPARRRGVSPRDERRRVGSTPPTGLLTPSPSTCPVDLSHRGPGCTLETLLRRHDLTDLVLWRIAGLVHEARHRRRAIRRARSARLRPRAARPADG